MNALRRPSTAVNALLALLIVGAALWGYALLRGDAAQDGANASGLRTVAVSQGAVTKTVTAGGTVASASTATATFGTEGTVTRITAKIGQQVAAGALLARIDATRAERQLKMARADLTAAEDALTRAEDAGTDTTAALNQVTRAELAVDEAKAAVDGTRLRAPMAGTVVAVNGTLGGTSASDDAGFVHLADLRKLQVTASFAEADVTDLREGQNATVVWNALENAETTGRVVAVDPAATTDGDTVTYGVTISLPNPPRGARPGQTVTVSVVTAAVENAVTVHPAAVATTGGEPSVTVLTGTGRREVRQVEVGLEGDEAYQITAGLTAGERVLLPGASTGDGGAPPGGR